MKLLIVIPFSANDAPLCERGLDFIYRLHGKRAIGHVLLVANPDCHAEMRRKIAVTAELAFESVTETVAPAMDAKLANSKFHQLNNLFRHAAKIAQDQCRWPWFWLEPDCVPVSADWISRLADAYDSQPKKYMGLIAKGKDDKKFMARCGIYYGAASYELDRLCQSDVPFPLATSEKVIPCVAETDLIDYLNIETPEDLGKISKAAVVVHGDKMGLFAENWESPPTTYRPAANSSGAMAVAFDPQVDFTMKPQEIAKEIGEFLKEPEKDDVIEALDEAIAAFGGPIATTPIPAIKTKSPRITRHQIAEAKDREYKLDCVATNGCKSSTETATP